jgi:DNA (cytosine-5)-methyltransferase 1
MNTFIDLFCGIGGIRIAFEKAGFGCVYSSELDKYCRMTYKTFFGAEPENDDIRNITINSRTIKNHVPDHNILTGGFPCQPFSLAGVSKKNSMNRSHGFEDETSGTLFFDIKEIIKAKEPDVILLENVKNLKSHNKNRTYNIISKTLKKPKRGLEYFVKEKIIDASKWVPQHRERIFILAVKKSFKRGLTEEFHESIFPNAPIKKSKTLLNILEDSVDTKYTVPLGTWNALKRHAERHKNKGNGFGYGKIDPPFKDKISRTLSARYYKDGAEILIGDGSRKRPRRLTPLECLRLQGFPKKYEKFYNGKLEQPVSDHQAYKQFGNSVSVPLLCDIARNINKKLF